MSSKESIRWVFYCLFIGVVLLFLSGCDITPTPTEPPPEAVFQCEQIEQVGSVETSEFTIDGQLILTGPQDAMARLVESLQGDGIDLIPVEICDLTYLEDLVEVPDQEFGYPPESGTAKDSDLITSLPFHNQESGEQIVPQQVSLGMNLYRFDNESLPLARIVREINERGQEFNVFVDPNYLVGHLAKSPCSNPFAIEGSPFAIEGSPFAIEGSPGGGLGAPADPNAFWTQWAFEKIQLADLYNGKVEASADGVRVGVFDTSPFNSPGTYNFPEIEPNLELTVHHAFSPPPLALNSTVQGKSPDVSDHGLFVSGLVHAAAPDSQIHLYQVLTKDGCGDLFTLIKSIHEFISSQRDNRGLIRNTVLNFSLGVLKPRDMRLIDLDSSEDSIESLELAVFEAFRRGGIIVAAAGNDSVDGNLRLGPELPAAYRFAIGVSASTRDDKTACYSNKGNVVAPGAEGPMGAQICEPLADSCPGNADANGNCDYGVISLARSSDTMYAYWVGTSFSTPLVSGLAATAYGTTNSQIGTFAAIWSGLQPFSDPEAGAGIINIPASLGP